MSTCNLLDFIQAKKPVYTGAGAAYPYSPALEKLYRFQPRYGEVTSLSHRTDDGMLLLPRALCPVGIEDRRAVGVDAHFPLCPQPRPYQVELFDQTAAFIGKKQSGVVLAYTGFGKTLIGYRAAYEVQKRTLVITTKEDIFDKWIAEAPRFLGISPERVGRIRGDVAEVLDADFCVAMIQSLYKDKYPAWVWEQFGLTIFDEVHRLPAEEFSKTVWKLPSLIRLGLSAKSTRKDGKDILIDAHIGPTRAKAEGEGVPTKVLRYRSAWKCPRFWDKSDPDHEPVLRPIPHEPGRTGNVDKRIANDPERNALLASIIFDVVKTPRRLVVFTTQNEHLNLIYAACVQAGIDPAAMAFYLGGATKKIIAENERAKTVPVTFTNYTKMGEGTDWPWLDTALFAMPRSDVEQPAGRARRSMQEWPSKRPSLLIDVVDADSPVYAIYTKNRARWYQRIGATVIDMN